MKHNGTRQELYAYIRMAVAILTNWKPCILPLDTLRETIDKTIPGSGDELTPALLLHALGPGYAICQGDHGDILLRTIATSDQHPAPGEPHNVSRILLNRLLDHLTIGEEITSRDIRRLIRANWMTQAVHQHAIDTLTQEGHLEAVPYRDSSNRHRIRYRLTDPNTNQPPPW